MVCIPCIVAPLLLWIWYKFIQPVVLKIWNPWEAKKPIKDGDKEELTTKTEAKCPISSFNKSEKESVEEESVELKEAKKDL